MKTGFDRALAAFRTAAATRLSGKTDDIEVGPPDQATADQATEKVGRLWAFRARLRDQPETDLFGWADPDGATVFHDQRLGALLAEAGAWDASPALPPRTMAERILWSLGGGRQLFVDRYDGAPPPALDLNQGAGTLRFFALIPGAAGRGGPDQRIEYIATLAPDRTATLTATLTAKTPVP